MTNNTSRRPVAGGSNEFSVDAANPRAYQPRAGSPGRAGNTNGHIIRMAEAGNDASATTFTWDVYLFGAEAGSDAATQNLSGLTADQDFSSPDGLWFSYATGLLWIQTDDGAFTDRTNCMLLAAAPGRVGDGAPVNVPSMIGTSTNMVTTFMGVKPTANTLKRFLVGPVECEITGITETPDGKALFVNVQHPGELTANPTVVLSDPSTYHSRWPGNAGYGAGGANARPRSATIVITKNDGGLIGS
jgi:uncharacterized protein